jgi:ABC-type polysaccharide/polyol phosphate transport system ATPase subunit
MSAAITVENVSKMYRLYHERNQAVKAALVRGRRARYEEFWALQDVSFEIEEGSTFGLVGENGSGKSTLLKCLANILRPDKGRIQVDGRVSALLELGAGFHPELSGRENVYLNGAILGLSKKQLNARFDEIVDFAGLEHFIDTPVKNYSSGMYIRLGFSVAINVDPDVLLIDEILAVGDAEFQQKCAEKFARLRETGKTIVLVSHALETIRNFCDHAVLLHHGVATSAGEAGKVVDDYLDNVHGRGGPQQGSTRYGSGEARIERVELLDGDGNATARVGTGDAMTLRVHYSTPEPVEQPVFGIAIRHVNGVLVTGPNTRDCGATPEKIDGSGYMDLHVERTLLLPGTYDVTASIWDYTITRPFDAIDRILRFDVIRGTPTDRLGFVSLDPKWTLVDDGRSS